MKLKFTILSLILVPFLLLGCDNNTSNLYEKEPNQINDLKPSKLIDISIKGHSHGRTIHGEGIIFRLYSDGTAIYSGNDLEPGPPYSTIEIAEDQIIAFFDEMKRHKIFSGKMRRFYSGPSSFYVEIHLNYEGQSIWYCSWHELFETNPNLVATENGIESLNGRDKTQVIESQGDDYKDFSYKWKLIRKSIRKYFINPV